MPLSDLLWACPDCGEPGGISPDGRCSCGVAFRRGKGAHIVATWPDGRSVERTPSRWVDMLDQAFTRLRDQAEHEDVIRRARVTVRPAVGTEAVHARGRFLNRIERYGPPVPGAIELRHDTLAYETDDDTPGRTWPFERITAIQTSSSTLQVKATDDPLVSFRFEADSLLLWEALIHDALRRFYRRTGRGKIVEFQPRIAAR